MSELLQQLLQAAIDKTERGALAWTEFTPTSFRVAIGPNYIHIQRGSSRFDGDDDYVASETKYSIQVTDELGRVVEDADVYQITPPNVGFQLADRLFRAARNTALKSNKVIESMLARLGAK